MEEHETLSASDAQRPSVREESQIGRYKLLSKLGEGGMGEVWLAEQQTPRRLVALKVIKRGMDSEQVIARFETERQALAMMDHPNIATVLDAGETESGRTYFVMEYVKGEPITTYCDRHRLTTADRLELFVAVCHGVQHAHHKAVIHRDIKPSNVLVTVQDGRPVPKIIDFGVAKATNQYLTERTLFTELGQLIGTPEYMSPEQAEMGGTDIDTRTDVYSLGVLLYELLTGVLPFDPKELRKGGLAEIQRRIREQEPAKPSTRVSSLGAALGEVAEKRRTSSSFLLRNLKGDLDWIAVKALEKDRTRRYESPADLGTDIRRYLADEPVSARPPSTYYRIRKFARRRRALFVATLSVVLAVVTGGGIAIYGLLEARRERDAALEAQTEAEEARDETQEVLDFVVGLFDAADPFEGPGGDLTVRELLGRGHEGLDTTLREQPRARATVLDTIGSVLLLLGDYASARPLLEEALATREELYGDGRLEVADSLFNLGDLLATQGELERGRDLLERSVEIRRRLAPPTDPELGTNLQRLAKITEDLGNNDEALSLYREALDALERSVGPEHSMTGVTLFNMGSLYRRIGQLEEAQRIYDRVMPLLERSLGAESPDFAMALYQYGSLRSQRSEHGEARRQFQRSYDILAASLGPRHLNTAFPLVGLGRSALAEGRYDEAERRLREALSIQEASVGREHPYTERTLELLDGLRAETGAR